MRTFVWRVWPLIFLCSFAVTAAELKPGSDKARWVMKTTVQSNAKEHEVSLQGLLDLDQPPDAARANPNYLKQPYPAFKNSLGIKEGDIITITGWIHLVAGEPDGDYHIQVSGSRTNGDNCVVVEVPLPQAKFVKNTKVRQRATDVRAFIRTKLFKGKEPSSGGSVLKFFFFFFQIIFFFFFGVWWVLCTEEGREERKKVFFWGAPPGSWVFVLTNSKFVWGFLPPPRGGKGPVEPLPHISNKSPFGK